MGSGAMWRCVGAALIVVACSAEPARTRVPRQAWRARVPDWLPAPTPAPLRPPSDARLRYDGPLELLRPAWHAGERFTGRFDLDFWRLPRDACRHVLAGAIGPAWVDTLDDGGVVLSREPYCDVHGVAGLPLVVARAFGERHAAHVFPDPGAPWMRGPALPDLSGDGVPEACVAQGDFAAPRWIAGSDASALRLRVRALDVVAGTELWAADFGAVTDGFWLSPPVRCPDLDADGREDLLLLVGRRGTARARVVALSSWDGATLREWEHAWAPLGSMGVVAAARLALLDAPSRGARAERGWRVALIAGAAQWVTLPFDATARVEPLREFRREELGVSTLHAFVPVGDLDGDGSTDVALAGSGHWKSCGGGLEVDDVGVLERRRRHGSVVFLSGHDGRELGDVTGARCGEMFGSALSVYDDVTGDGQPELLVLAAQGRGQALRLIDPRTGSTLGAWPGEGPDPRGFGVGGDAAAVVSIPDRDGDGLREVLVSLGDGEAYEGCQSVDNALVSGVLCVSSRAFFTRGSRDRDPGSQRDG